MLNIIKVTDHITRITSREVILMYFFFYFEQILCVNQVLSITHIKSRNFKGTREVKI